MFGERLLCCTRVLESEDVLGIESEDVFETGSDCLVLKEQGCCLLESEVSGLSCLFAFKLKCLRNCLLRLKSFEPSKTS